MGGRQEMGRGGVGADIPKPPKMIPVVAAGDTAPGRWRFTTDKPSGDWSRVEFDDSTWKESLAGFGAGDPPGAFIKTPWTSSDIWLRRQIAIPTASPNLQLWMHHDEDAEVFINGVPEIGRA